MPGNCPSVRSGSDATLPIWTVEPTWPHQDRAVDARNDVQREELTDYITRAARRRPRSARQGIPDFRSRGKRMLQDNGSWVAALKRPNVELVTDRIASIDENAVIDATGKRHEVDVIPLAIEFQADR